MKTRHRTCKKENEENFERFTLGNRRKDMEYNCFVLLRKFKKLWMFKVGYKKQNKETVRAKKINTKKK